MADTKYSDDGTNPARVPPVVLTEPKWVTRYCPVQEARSWLRAYSLDPALTFDVMSELIRTTAHPQQHGLRCGTEDCKNRQDFLRSKSAMVAVALALREAEVLADGHHTRAIDHATAFDGHLALVHVD